MVKRLRHLYAFAVLVAGAAAAAVPNAALAHAPGSTPGIVIARTGAISATDDLTARPLQKPGIIFSGALASRMPLTYDDTVKKYPIRSAPWWWWWQPRRKKSDQHS